MTIRGWGTGIKKRNSEYVTHERLTPSPISLVYELIINIRDQLYKHN